MKTVTVIGSGCVGCPRPERRLVAMKTANRLDPGIVNDTDLRAIIARGTVTAPGLMNLITRTLLTAAAAVLLVSLPPTTAFSQAQPPPGTSRQRPKVTFVELGSVKCVPCRMMQPVMESIGRKYGDQIEIVFHDVWTDSGRTHAGPYNIRAIPTQVFLDAKGVEFHRHEGFYPEAEIDKLLVKRGLKALPPRK